MDITKISLPEPTRLPETLTPDIITHLAREVVRNIHELDVILPRYGLTPGQYEKLRKTEFYKRIHNSYSVEWNSSDSTEKRMKLEALAYLEAAMPLMGAKMTDPRQELKAQVDAGKFFAHVGGLTKDRSGIAAETEKFVINLNFGANKVVRTVDITPRKEPETPEEIEE